ncbi:hypothetical protein MJO28_007245 [Puccinia striiformis f. sp. tritici]|uniref:Uncharacterized protein n=1 Tax=Puccinia striiformis f. sp. tritici TaxID=168172 RepID=A0ACC0EE11_9BASI|nr:hypothetical protein MJO28_007245 [Puccinia striiformis f. sp. tritici]
MILPIGLQWSKMIVFSVFCLRVTHSMNTPLVAKESKDFGKSRRCPYHPSTKKIIAQAAVSISFADVVKPQKGQVFRGNQAFNKPSVSPGDTAQYFKSIREMTKPSPGLSVEHLDDARGSTSPYWSAVHINSLAEDFETMFEDLHKLGKAIEKRKTRRGKNRSYSKEDRKYAKGQLTEVAQDLKAVHLNSLQYIERFLERWAAANDVSKRKIFGDKIFSLTKKKTAGQKNELPLGDPETIKGIFPKDRLQRASSTLSILSHSSNLDPNQDQHVWALHRIFIQTVDQAYKFNLLDLEDFKKYVKKTGYATDAARSMFLHFTRSTTDYKNPMYRNSDILLELWYSSPFVNMLNVIDAPEKRKFLHEIIKSDALDYIGGRHDGLVEKHLVRTLKQLFENNSLLSALEDGSLGVATERSIQKIINVCLDDLVLKKEWRDSEALRLMARTLEFIDGTYLQTESSTPTLTRLRGMFKDPLRNRIKLVSARAKATVELEKISKYLHERFPLRNDVPLQKPIPTLEELDLIEGHLEHLPAQQDYESAIKTSDDWHKSWRETENDEKMIALRMAIDKIRPKHVASGSSRSYSDHKMVIHIGYQAIKVIVLVLCLRVTQCMNKPLLTKEGTKDLGKARSFCSNRPYTSLRLKKNKMPQAAAAVSLNDVMRRPRGHVFREDREMKKPSVSQGDHQQYFKSIREITKPSPGYSVEQLDHIGRSVNPYWPAAHMNSLAADFEMMSEDLQKLAMAIEKRKFRAPGDGSFKLTGHEADKAQLLEIAQDLQAVHDNLQLYIERLFSLWASQNGVLKRNIFSDKFLSLKKKKSAGQEKDLMISAENIKGLFPIDRLKNAYKNLSTRFHYFKPKNDRDFWALHRIYIQTVDQTYKHNLLGFTDFEELVEKRDYAENAAYYMFLHFTHVTNDYKNPLYRNSDILLELWYSSPFVNMLNVIDPRHKARFLHQIIKMDALDYTSTPRPGLIEKHLARSLKDLFEHNSLLGSLENGYTLSRTNQLSIKTIVTVFLDNLLWDKEWGNSEAMRLAAQTLKFIDGTYLHIKPLNPTTSAIDAMFKPIRNKINLFSARAQAIVELEKFSKYLHESFPLRNDGSLQKPIPISEELNLIEGHLEHLPAQDAYHKVVKGQDDRHKPWCEEDIDAKMIALKEDIDKVRGTSWIYNIFK